MALVARWLFLEFIACKILSSWNMDIDFSQWKNDFVCGTRWMLILCLWNFLHDDFCLYISFTKRKINLQQVSLTKISTKQVQRTNTARNEIHDQNPFYEEKINTGSTKRKNRIIQVWRRIINNNQAPRIKISAKQVPWTKSVSWGGKSICKVQKEKK